MQTIPYQGVQLIPLVPVEEAPTLMAAIDAQPGVTSLPYIVYTWTKINTGQAYFLKTHEFAYSIRSADDDKMGQLINLFDKLFQSYDKAALEVNQYIQSFGSEAQKKFQFKKINIENLGGQLPAESENGVNESLATIRVTYVGG
jgi:hypothetical protein